MKLKHIFLNVALPSVIGGSALLLTGCFEGTSQATPHQTVVASTEMDAGFEPPTKPTESMCAMSITGEHADASVLQPLVTASGEKYTVAKGDSLWTIAKQHHVSVGSLCELNHLERTTPLHPGMELEIPAAHKQSGICPIVAEMPLDDGKMVDRANEATPYVVQKGDSLSKIAHRAHVTTAALKAANNLKSDIIRVGQKLIIPSQDGCKLSLQTSAPRAESKKLAPITISPEGTYVVCAGDSIDRIAKATHTKVSDLIAWNHIKNPKHLRIGQKLTLRAPTVSDQATPQVAAPTTTETVSREKSTEITPSTPAPQQEPAAATADNAPTPEESAILSGAGDAQTVKVE